MIIENGTVSMGHEDGSCTNVSNVVIVAPLPSSSAVISTLLLTLDDVASVESSNDEEEEVGNTTNTTPIIKAMIDNVSIDRAMHRLVRRFDRRCSSLLLLDDDDEVVKLQDGERGDSASMSLSTPLIIYMYVLFIAIVFCCVLFGIGILILIHCFPKTVINSLYCFETEGKRGHRLQ